SPLYDVRNPAGKVCKDVACEVMFRGRFSRHLVQALLLAQEWHRASISSGGARRDRTDDLMLAKHALSQLSYGPVPEDECCLPVMRRMRSIKVVGLGRLELPTSRLSSARSNQLSYKPKNPSPTVVMFGLTGRVRKRAKFFARKTAARARP